ncbi:MAG: hypothetical protein HY754_04405 [Nitrospirae bacterium]|nr:hypothetical protein [Nitrospirota bacterium]
MLKFEDRDNTETWYRPVHCYKFYCPTCGGKHGELHKKRISDVLNRIILKGYFIRQFVFTVPESKRQPFQSRKGLNALIRIVKRIIDKEFGKEKLMVMYIHLFGDRDKSKYHPHINVHMFEKEGKQSWKLSEEKLKKIRERYNRALTSYMKEKEILEVVNVNYSYRVGIGKMLHSITYMTRPTDAGVLDVIDEKMKQFLLCELKGFQYIRGYEMCKGKKNKEFLVREFGSWDVVEKKGVTSPLTGKPLFCVDIVSSERFEMYTEEKQVETRNGLLRLVDGENI